MAKKKTAPRKAAQKRAALKATPARRVGLSGPFHPFIQEGLALIRRGIGRLEVGKRRAALKAIVVRSKGDIGLYHPHSPAERRSKRAKKAGKIR